MERNSWTWQSALALPDSDLLQLSLAMAHECANFRIYNSCLQTLGIKSNRFFNFVRCVI